MNSLYSLALRQVSSLQSDLATLEQAISNRSSTAALNGQITASLSALSRTTDDYEGLSKGEVVEAKREKAKTRIQRFRDDYASLRKQFDRAKHLERTAKSEDDRSELFASTSAVRSPTAPTRESPFAVNMHRTNASMSAASHYGGGPGGGSQGGYRTNAALNENSFVHSTNNTLDAYIAQGQAILGNLGDQRDMLKGTQRRLRSAANTLGLSRETIQFVERRSKGDMFVLGVGAVGTLGCFYWILKVFG